MKNLTTGKKMIAAARDIVITCHINPDGDTVGSMLALGLGLRQLDKNVVMVSQDGIPKRYRPLPGADQVRQRLPEGGQTTYDLAITVDCSSPEIVGMEPEDLKRCRAVLEIDHHEFRESFGTLALIDPKAAANGEIVYTLFKAMKLAVTPDIARNLLTSLIVETNSFRLPSVTATTFRVCTELMKTGLDFTALTDMVYWAERRESVVLTGICLSRCRFSGDGQIAWTIVRQDDFRKTGGLDEDVDAVPDILRSIHDVSVAVFFREHDHETLRVSLRSKGTINIARVARQYNGGGHYDVAGCFIPNRKDAIEGLLEKIPAVLAGHQRQAEVQS